MKIFKRDYLRQPKSDAPAVMASLDCWFEDHIEVHPQPHPGMCSPRQFLGATIPPPVRSDGNSSARAPLTLLSVHATACLPCLA